MSNQTDIVHAYMDGFRRSDKPGILALLTDDVVWDLPGFRHLSGKADFEGEIVNPLFEENPTLVVDRTLEDGDTVVCIGEGSGQMKTGDEFRFAFCDVFTFRDDLIHRVESYIVPLTGPRSPSSPRGARAPPVTARTLSVVLRTIVGFVADDIGDWVALLECHHRQHVRHRPPFRVAPWVEDAAERDRRIGTRLDCPLCDRCEIPEGLTVMRTTATWDERTMPDALRRDHRVASGTWGRLRVESGSLRFVARTEPITDVDRRGEHRPGHSSGRRASCRTTGPDPLRDRLLGSTRQEDRMTSPIVIKRSTSATPARRGHHQLQRDRSDRCHHRRSDRQSPPP